jgi:hypothetical protein
MTTCHPSPPIDPVGLAMLQRIFDSACKTRNIARGGTDGENLAATLVQLYEQGIRQEHQLTLLIQPH